MRRVTARSPVARRQNRIDLENAQRTVDRLGPRRNNILFGENSVQENDIPHQVNVVGVSNRMLMDVFISKCVLFELHGFRIGYEDLAHPIPHLKQLRDLEIGSEREWLALVLGNELLQVVLTVLPQVICQPGMNIVDVADDVDDRESDKETLGIQIEWLDDCLEFLESMLKLNLSVVKQFIIYLVDPVNFKALFCQDDEGNCGFLSDINKKIFTTGVFYAFTNSIEHHGIENMDMEMKGTSIEVLGKLSHMIDCEIFGTDGAITQISKLMEVTENKTHKNILFKIILDIHNRQEYGPDPRASKKAAIINPWE